MLKMVAIFLVALKPAAAFNPVGLAGRCPKGILAICNGCKYIGHQGSIMSSGIEDASGGGSNCGYVGRFAPTPSGPLHEGSLLAAIASYLDARAHGGMWLLRVEDVDGPRVVPGAVDAQVKALEAHGLEWDGPIVYQSQRGEAYQAALEALAEKGRIFYCNCSRRDLKNMDVYPGTCRGATDPKHIAYRTGSAVPGTFGQCSHSVRFRVDTGAVQWDDRVLGPQAWKIERSGDFVVKRRDGLFAYQLAVVIDDAEAGVTSIVRGRDLLESTAWQCAIQSALGILRPSYAHLPLLMDSTSGEKLSKSHGATPVDVRSPSQNIVQALKRLNQPLPCDESQTLSVEELMTYAVQHWDISRVRRVLPDGPG